MTALFRCSEGVHRGAVKSGHLFGLGCNDAFQALNNRLKPLGGGVMTIVDDNYGCLSLMDRTDNNNSHVAGRLNIPALTNLFGEGSFNHPLDKP